MMDMGYNRKLILEDGEEYYGFAFGCTGDKVPEIVSNTSMAGDQEIFTLFSSPGMLPPSRFRSLALKSSSTMPSRMESTQSLFSHWG